MICTHRSNRPRRRTLSGASGFSLVESLIVVLIIGILLTLGLPTFLEARTRAHDARASAAIRTATLAGIDTSELRSDFLLASVGALDDFEPELEWVDGSTPSTRPEMVSVDASASDRWVAVVRSDSGTCFAVVLGTGGQRSIETSSCAANGVDLPAPDASPSVVVHEGALTAVTPGMCLEVVGGFLSQQPCTGSQEALQISTRPDGYSTISLSDGACFGTNSTNRGARVAEEICEETDDQLWTVIPSFEGTVQFKNKETGYCMDVNGNSSSAGAHIISWGYGDSPNGTCKSTTSANNHNFGLG